MNLLDGILSNSYNLKDKHKNKLTTSSLNGLSNMRCIFSRMESVKELIIKAKTIGFALSANKKCLLA